MRKVAEAHTCRNKCGLAFHWEIPSFAIGFSYGTCNQEAEFGCWWLTGIVVLTEVDSAREENAATGATKASTTKSTENWRQNYRALNLPNYAKDAKKLKTWKELGKRWMILLKTRAAMWGFQELQKWAAKFDLKQNGKVMFTEHLESWHVLGYKIHASNIQTLPWYKHNIEYKFQFDYWNYMVLFTKEWLVK